MKELLEGPSSFGEKFEHVTMLGCHFRSERLDSLSKVTQDSGLKANLAVRRLENGETVRKLYFGRMQYALRVQVGTEMREYLRVIWYGKPQYDVAHGLWLVKKDAVLSDKWRPFVRLQDVTGQVFYGDDPREPSIRVVLQKELGLENIARAAGDASDFARSAVPKSEADEQAFGVGEKPAAGFGERGDPKDGEAEVGKPAKAEAGHRGLEANADRNSQSVAGKPLRKRRRNGKAEKPEPKTRRAAVRASAPQNLSSDDEEEAARVANENEVVEKPLHVLQALQNLKPSGRLPLPTGLKSCLEWLDAEVGPETVMSKLPDAASKVRGQEIVIRARDLATLKANMELNDQVSVPISPGLFDLF